jgi:hypothetical protein
MSSAANSDVCCAFSIRAVPNPELPKRPQKALIREVLQRDIVQPRLRFVPPRTLALSGIHEYLHGPPLLFANGHRLQCSPGRGAMISSVSIRSAFFSHLGIAASAWPRLKR